MKNRSKFTKKQIEKLNKSEFIESVTDKVIIFTEDFKKLFVEECKRGINKRMIFNKYGIDPNILGRHRIYSSTCRWIEKYNQLDKDDQKTENKEENNTYELLVPELFEIDGIKDKFSYIDKCIYIKLAKTYLKVIKDKALNVSKINIDIDDLLNIDIKDKVQFNLGMTSLESINSKVITFKFNNIHHLTTLANVTVKIDYDCIVTMYRNTILDMLVNKEITI